LPLKRLLVGLSDENKRVPTLRLADLSDLPPAEVELFQQSWKGIGIERRRQVINRLIALAANNASLSFEDVFISCLSDSDPVVRAKAIEGLWECQDCSLILTLMEMLAGDEEEVVRAAAASALGRFALLAELRKVAPRHTKKIEDALFGVIESEGEKVELRCRAIEAVAPLSSSRVKRVIYKAYQSENLRLRASALWAMGLNCDPAWLTILLKELSSPELEMCLEAARACGELGEEEAVPHLLRLTEGADIQTQLAAVVALKQLEGSEAKQALYQCLHHPDERVRQVAEEALGEAGI
jgi:HEAT repeat protein